MIASFQDSEAAWQIRSEIDGRLRIFHPGLSNSLGLRRHCSSVLHRTHWLISHRINVVAAGLVDAAAEKYADYFPGHNPVPMERVVNGYVRAVEGRGNGEIIRVYW